MNLVILSRNEKLYSTRRLKEAALEKGHNVRVIDHVKCILLMEQGKPVIHYNGEDIENIDAIIPRIGSSVTFFGTAVVRQFELQSTFCVNDSQAIQRSRDKLRSLQIMAQFGLGVPKTVFAKYPKNKDVDDLVKQIGGAPLIIKILEGTQGLGVMLAESNKAAKSAIEAFSGIKTNILVQEFIKEAAGADIRVFIVGGKVVGAMKRQGKEGDFRSNIHRGGSAMNIKLTSAEKKAALKAAESMDLNVCGVDLLQSARGPLILEVNSSPGLQGIEKATQVDIAGEIIAYIEKKVKSRKSKIKGMEL